MSYKTKVRLKKAGKLGLKLINEVWDAVELIMIDLTHGKSQYRRNYRTARIPRQRTVYREHVIIRPSAPRLVVVDKSNRVKAIR